MKSQEEITGTQTLKKDNMSSHVCRSNEEGAEPVVSVCLTSQTTLGSA